MEKRYYWSKLNKDFMSRGEMKKLVRISGGTTPFTIYMTLLASSIDAEGIIEYKGLEDSFAGEIALLLDEDEQKVQQLLDFLMKTGLLKDIGNNQYRLSDVADNVGSECASTRRVRKHRAKLKALQCNESALQSNVEKEKEKKREINKKKTTHLKRRREEKFVKPTVEEVQAEIEQKNYHVNAQEFWDYHEECNWVSDGDPVRDWKKVLYAWNKNDKPQPQRRKKTKQKISYGDFQQNTYDFKQLENDLIQN